MSHTDVLLSLKSLLHAAVGARFYTTAFDRALVCIYLVVRKRWRTCRANMKIVRLVVVVVVVVVAVVVMFMAPVR